MALSSKVGSFAMNGSTGNQSISGLGFQPKIVFFWATSQTGDGAVVNIQGTHGIAVSSSDRRAVGYAQPDNNIPGSGGNTLGGHYNDRCIRFMQLNGNTASFREADFVSMDSDGFTINIGTTDGTQSIINYLAIGGTDVTNVKTGQFQASGSTGNQAVSGVGFEGDALIYIRGRATTTAPSSGSNSPVRASWGFATSSSARGVSTVHARSSGSAFESKAYQRTNKVIAGIADGGSVQSEADFVSFGADGFTINWSTASANIYVFYAVIQGASFTVGNFNQATSTGNQPISGLGFQPTGVLMTSVNRAGSTSVSADTRLSVGGFSATTERATTWLGQDDGTTNSDNAQTLDRDEVIQMYTEPTPTLNAEADLSSMDSDGFTLNWSTADATAREIIYFAMGNVSAGSASSSISPSPSASVSPSSSVSPSPSLSISPSPSLSVSLSPSSSVSPSSSISLSPSVSVSLSPSSSQSPSSSISLSPSVSVSLSPSASQSPSSSISPSPSASVSPTPSVSISLSPSLSVSLSPSATPSLSVSLSPSLSFSATSSSSPSLSSSLSPSRSPSLSASSSVSRSFSPSPSPTEYELYTDVYLVLLPITYTDKYYEKNTTYTDNYVEKNTAYSDKYTDNDAQYTRKYPPTVYQDHE